MPMTLPATPEQSPPPVHITVEVRINGVVVHAAGTNTTARDNAGVNPIPDLLRMMANQIEDWCP